MKKSNKVLVQTICAALAAMGMGMEVSFAAANSAADVEEMPAFEIAEVVVRGQRYIAGEFMRATNDVGVLGKRDMMSCPISVSTISEKAVDSFLSSTEGLSKILSLVPSVQKSHDIAVDCVKIRGFADTGRGFSINGIPGMQAMTRQSTNYIDSIDVIEGPASGVAGSGNTKNEGGTININSKKGIDVPITNVGIKWSLPRALEESIDVGRRFGDKNRYGIRINAAHVNGERAIEGWNLKQQNVYINVDQKTAGMRTNYLFGFTHTNSSGRPYGFSLAGTYAGDHIPAAVRGSANHNPSWREDKNTNLVMTLNHEMDINRHLTAFLNAGHFKQDWYYYLGFDKTLLNQNGDFKASSDNYSLIEKRDYLQLGLRGDFKTGIFTHNYTAAVDRTWEWYGGVSDYQEVVDGWFSNLYHCDPSQFVRPNLTQADAYYTSKTRISGWSVTDTMASDDGKWQILVGVGGKSIEQDSYKNDGSHKKKVGSYHAVSPFYGINYTFTPRFSMYANHTETFREGTIVGPAYKNKGEVLNPLKTKENEIGLKLKTGDFFHKLSYFVIERDSYTTVIRSDGDYLTYGGQKTKHRGFEYTGTGSLCKKWNIIGGFMHLDAKTSAGKRADGVPDWSANFGVEYRADEQFSVLTRINYMGSSDIKDEKYSVPSYFTLDLGARYKTNLNRVPVTLNFMVYNLFDKKYWAPTGNTLHTGAPRAFMLSAAMEL